MNISKIFRHLTRYLTHRKHFSSNLPKRIAQDQDAVDLAYNTYDYPKSVLQPDPPLIIMHGLMGSKMNYTAFCNRFAIRIVPPRRAIALDARNHGESPYVSKHNYELLALDVKRFMDSHGIKRASLLGHSMGGRALMMFALKWPELVEKLIIEESSPLGSCPNMQKIHLILNTIKDSHFSRELSLSSARKQANELLSTIIIDRGMRENILANLRLGSNNRVEWRLNVNALNENSQEILVFPEITGLKFDGPTLFIVGNNTETVPNIVRKDIRQLFPNAKFQQMSNGGHVVHCENLDDFLDVVLDFLTDIIS